jgi:hypothetical protein
MSFVGCQFFRNGTYGVSYSGIASLVILFCDFFSNNSGNILSGFSHDALMVVANCTLDGDGDTSLCGIYLYGTNRQMPVVINNIIYDHATGIISPNQGEAVISRNNLVNGNTTPYNGFQTLTGEVTDAPEFVDEGGNDYSLQGTSPALDAGYDQASAGMDIGAHQATSGGGGGANVFKVRIGA